MSGSYFSDKERQPTNNDLKKVLGQKYSLWTLIRKSINKKQGVDDVEWKYYGKKNGWLAKNIVKKRNIFFLSGFLSLVQGFFPSTHQRNPRRPSFKLPILKKGAIARKAKAAILSTQ